MDQTLENTEPSKDLNYTVEHSEFGKLEIQSGHFTSFSLEIQAKIMRNKVTEFNNIPKMGTAEQANSTMILVMSGEQIVAQMQLIDIPPLTFNGKEYKALGIAGVLVIKQFQGKGLGNILAAANKQYLKENNTGAIGFCGEPVMDFYSKQGLTVRKDLKPRFVYTDEAGEEHTNQFHAILAFGMDDFIQEMDKHPEEKVELQRMPDW